MGEMDELNVPELTNNPNLNRVEDLEKEDFKKEEKVIMDIDIIAFDEEMSKLEALYSKILVHVSIDIAGLNKTTYEINKKTRFRVPNRYAIICYIFKTAFYSKRIVYIP